MIQSFQQSLAKPLELSVSAYGHQYSRINQMPEKILKLAWLILLPSLNEFLRVTLTIDCWVRSRFCYKIGA